MYTFSAAEADFRNIISTLGVDGVDIDEALNEAKAQVEEGEDGLILLRHAIIAADEEADGELDEALLDKDGFLWTVTLGAQDGYDAGGMRGFLDEEGKNILDGGELVASCDADGWVKNGENVFRVHPEGVTPLGAYLPWVKKQVELATTEH